MSHSKETSGKNSDAAAFRHEKKAIAKKKELDHLQGVIEDLDEDDEYGHLLSKRDINRLYE